MHEHLPHPCRRRGPRLPSQRRGSPAPRALRSLPASPRAEPQEPLAVLEACVASLELDVDQSSRRHARHDSGMDSTLRPWYREPWPWLLMSGPAIVVVAGCLTAGIAWKSDDGLVADDYY